MKKTASIVIPTYNRFDLLSQTLQSVADCKGEGGPFEVIVVDDGSSDRSFDVVAKFERQLDIRYVFQPDRGFRLSRAKNMGIALAEGDVCIFIDSGIVVPSWFVSAHVNAHDKGNDTVVIGNLLGFDYNDANTAHLEKEMDGRTIDELTRQWQAQDSLRDPREPAWLQCHDDLMQLPAPWALAWGGNLSVHRDLLKSGIRFDENYQSWGAEDQDFALALYKAGGKYRLGRNAVAIHVPHPKSEANNDASVRKNKTYLHSKYNLPETAMLIDTRAVELNARLAGHASRAPA